MSKKFLALAVMPLVLCACGNGGHKNQVEVFCYNLYSNAMQNPCNECKSYSEMDAYTKSMNSKGWVIKSFDQQIMIASYPNFFHVHYAIVYEY